jgi:hypothetical protein
LQQIGKEMFGKAKEHHITIIVILEQQINKLVKIEPREALES